MKIMTAFEYNELVVLQSAIMVECWKHIQNSGSKRRRYHEAFNEKERRLISKYYKIFYQWHLVSGIPQKHIMKISTYQLMQRAIAFFASI